MATVKKAVVPDLMHFLVDPFPGCCGIRVLLGLYMEKPNATITHNDWELVCSKHGINTLVATTTPNMAKVNDYLAAQGNWARVELPRNPNTGNILYLWTYEKVDPLEYYNEDEEEDDY